MYISEFLAGVLSTLFIEVVAIVVGAFISINKSNRRK